MKKLLISTLTFVLGICAVFIWFSYQSNKIAEVNPPILLKEKCLTTKNFYGFSKKISEIKKGKSGYFPEKTFFDSLREDIFIKNEPLDIYVDKFYGKHLQASQEKSLLDITDKSLEVYRFDWMRGFYYPIFVRIEKRIDKIELVFKELDGQGGEPNKIICEKKVSISEEQWCKFKELLNQADFWKMPTLINNDGLDSAGWILEGVKENHYQIVYRASPAQTKYREACVYLLELAGFDKNKDDLY